MNRSLKEEKLLETGERFPGSGLSEVAAELVQLTRESVGRAAKIRRPNLWLRAGLVLLGLVAAAGIGEHFWASPDPRWLPACLPNSSGIRAGADGLPQRGEDRVQRRTPAQPGNLRVGREMVA